MPSIVLAFDIGIRNLAWCLVQGGQPAQILAWENYDLLAGQAANEKDSKKQVCSVCSAQAKYQTGTLIFCGRHCPAAQPPLRDLSGVLLKKVPAMKQLQGLCAVGTQAAPKTRAACLERLGQRWSLPIEKPKVTKAVEMELTRLHDGIRAFVESRKTLFHQATEILLENQPVLKNPTMKSVQMLLFATLRDILQPSPPRLRLVHAKKKVEGAAKGDAGYKARKAGSEDRAVALLVGGKVAEGARWLTHLGSYTKKNDLTDAFCMCWDALEHA